MDKLPIDDEGAYRVLQEARTTGVFQLESTGMKRYLKQLKPTVFEDIIAMVALYRPGTDGIYPRLHRRQAWHQTNRIPPPETRADS
jgi:DNA polymerase-3 subunit alpha